MNSTITALKTKLFVAKLDESRLNECSYALTRQLFYSTDENHSRFFSFTRTAQETSLILEEDALAEFPPFSLRVVKTRWRALSVSLGSVGYTGTGIVSSLSTLLAKAGIPLFYLSTSNMDFVLVPESKMDRAISALKSTFTIYAEGETEPEEDDEDEADAHPHVNGHDIFDSQPSSTQVSAPSSATSTPTLMRLKSPSPKPDPFADLQQHMSDIEGAYSMFKLTPSTPPCTLRTDQLRLCHISKENRELCMYAILKLIFFSKDHPSFWSISETEDEMSLLIPEPFLAHFPPEALNASDIWRPIQRFKKESFSEVGVVAALSAPLARGRIPLLYLSTYLSAFILVQAKNVNAATICLQSGKFQVIEQQGDEIS